MELWEKLRRFLLFWLMALVVLIIASLVVHGPSMLSVLASDFRAKRMWFFITGVVLVMIVLLMRNKS